MVLVAAEAVNTPAAVKSAAQFLPLKRRTMAVGIVNTAPNLGNIVAPLTVIPFAVAFGWKAAFLATGALGFAADAIPAQRVATVMAIGAIAGNVAGFGIQEATGRLLTTGYGYTPLFYGAAVAYLLALAWIHLLVPRIVAEDDGAG